MPLPWDSGARVRIPNVADRAITIQQLRDLRTFLQRLCKSHLLKRSTDFSKRNGTFGSTLDWYNINLYEITDEVIKRVIPFVDAGKEDSKVDPIDWKWYSWVEFVAKRPQRARIMISHWWGGHFCDFMIAIDAIAQDKALSINTPIWVCTFANCQWGEDFGALLMECPFIQVLKVAEVTAHIVDRFGGSLGRSWCGLELHYTVEHDIDLELYTSAGRVGSAYVSSGPLVEAVQSWDIRQTEATEPSYRRQILNYIAEVNELDGLQKGPDGQTPVLECGRPLLADTQRDPEAVRRSNGDEEFTHESFLFKAYGKKFEDLNMMVRLRVMANIGFARRCPGCTVENPVERGVSLGQFRAFVRKVRASCGQWKPPCSWEDVLMYSVCDQLVKPATLDRKCSYMELIAHGPQTPQYFIEYTWGSPFSKTAKAVEWFAEALHLPDSAVLWIDILANNQHTITEELKNWDNDIQSLGMFQALRECNGTLKCLDKDESTHLRAWCHVGTEISSRIGKPVYLGCSDGVLACSRPFPTNGCFVCGSFDSDIARLMRSVDVARCQTRQESDMQKILNFFDEVPGGAEKYKHRMGRFAAGPILRSAAQRDDSEEIADVCRTPGLFLNSETLKGGLGEMALHVAAGAGAVAALRALLQARIDPNTEDGIGERPLHYASMAGHVEAVQTLIAAGADPFGESSFAESPLLVAEQNPAGFLGVSTTKVVAELKEAARQAAAASNAQASPSVGLGSDTATVEKETTAMASELEALRRESARLRAESTALREKIQAAPPGDSPGAGAAQVLKDRIATLASERDAFQQEITYLRSENASLREKIKHAVRNLEEVTADAKPKPAAGRSMEAVRELQKNNR